MPTPWSVERWRLLGLIASILFSGLVSGYWIPAIVLPTAIYIGWLLMQLRQLEIWVTHDAKRKNAPTGSGVWAEIVQHIHRNRRKERSRKRRLAEMVNRFSATASALPYATVILTKHHEIEWSNPAAARLLGINRNRDQGQRIDNLIRDPNFQRFLHDSPAQQRLTENNSEPETDNEILEIRSPVDDQIILNLRKVPFGNQQSLITARNISKTVALQRMRKTFIANASHELRTPLTVILGYLEGLVSTPAPATNPTALPAAMQKALQRSYEQAQRMQSIIDDLLTLSRLESSASLSDTLPEPISVLTILKDIEQELKQSELAGKRQLTVHCDPQLQLMSKPADLHSLAYNLILNAIHHTPDGTQIQADWQADQTGGAKLSVSDNGDGIEAQHLVHLTERFYRVDNDRSRLSGGTGLGLAIVKQIVQGLEGQLDIQSTPGQGASFHARFPNHRVFCLPANLPSKPTH